MDKVHVGCNWPQNYVLNVVVMDIRKNFARKKEAISIEKENLPPFKTYLKILIFDYYILYIKYISM